jgi:predicted lysophospholipase L1 biosynthesis ABC-type transport system permease subunit
VQRALGFSPARIAGFQAMEGVIVAVPAAVLGIAVGAVAVGGPASTLLASLNELAPGAALLGPLTGATAVVVAIVVGAATWPAWRAARRPPAAILRGGDLATGRAPGRSARGGLVGLGARFATAARGRWAATVATLAVCAGVVALMLALASLLERLRDDPGTIGKRYQLLAQADATALPAVRRIPGVAGAALRYEVDAADAFRLGQSLRLVAYPGDHTRYEAPPLAAGRRLRGPGEAEVGAGLADALGLQPGSTLAVQLPNGRETRFRVSGIVRALEHDGRIAWVGTDRLLDTDPAITPALAVTARERRRAVALLRATGADGWSVAAVLAGAALAVALPGAVLGIVLETTVLGPLVARLAAGFADVPIGLPLGQAALVGGGLLALAAAATAVVARRVLREPVIAGLREE